MPTLHHTLAQPAGAQGCGVNTTFQSFFMLISVQPAARY
jgi:hypothetical protein